jgi:hypothetical protein
MATIGSEAPSPHGDPEPRDCPPALLEYSRSLFEQHVASFERVDRKVLGVVGVVAFLVGFQVLRSQDTPSLGGLLQLGGWGAVALVAYCIHGVTLFLTVIFSLFSLRVRHMSFPADAGVLLRRYRDLLNESAPDAEERIRVAIMKAFDDAAITVRGAVAAKARPLRSATISLAISVLGLFVYLVYLLSNSWGSKVGGIQ